MYKGIYQLPSDNFQVKIGYDGGRFNLGTYPTERKAIDAIQFFRDRAEGRSLAEQQTLAEGIREAAKKVLKQNPNAGDKPKAATMRQDVKDHGERIEQLERQVKMLMLSVQGRAH